MGEDTNINSSEYESSGNNLHTLQTVNLFKDEPDSMCAVILDSAEVAFLPLETNEEVVYYDGSQEDVKVEIDVCSDGYQDVYSEIRLQSDLRCVRSKPQHKNAKQGPHVCKVCCKQFTQLVNLTTHERIHTGEKPFKCEVCLKLFSQQPNLWKHMRTHTGERPYQCSTCKKRFTQQANLTKHIRTHTGERPYPCQYCGKRFTQQANLTKHIRLHTGERPFHCHYCSKTFVQQSNLERHVRTHTGVKPFKCNICGDCFAQNAHLSKHLRSIHKTVVSHNAYYFEVSDSCEELTKISTVKESENGGNDLCDPSQKFGIPVLYCTKTGKILKRAD